MRHSNASSLDERCQFPLTIIHSRASTIAVNLPLLPHNYLIALVLEKYIGFDSFYPRIESIMAM